MSVASRLLPPPRYGSAAEVSALTGLSVKTIRRRIKDGSLRGVRLGRRVLIPLDAIDRPQPSEAPLMAIAPTPARPGGVDPTTGRLRHLTDEERRARSEALNRGLDELEQITDETDTDEMWREFMRGIDEGRPHRPLFEGMY